MTDLLVEKMRKCEGLFLATNKGATYEEFARVLRLAMTTLRQRGALPRAKIIDATDQVLGLFQMLPRQKTTVGSFSVYPLNGGGKVLRRTFLDKGGYNLVFRSEWIPEEGAPSEYTVLRLVKHIEDEQDYIPLMTFVETCISLLLGDTGTVVRTICPLKVEKSTDPGYSFGSLMMNATTNGNTMHTLMSRNERSLNDEWCFGAFLLILEQLELMQRECKFMHRDLKSDNIVFEDDTTREVIECEGETCDVLPIKVKFLDFGFTEFTLENGERIGCDPESFLVRDPQRFNDSVDVVYFAFTMLEDSGSGFVRQCPRFVAMLSDIVDPLMTKIRRRAPGYDHLRSGTRNEIFLNTVFEKTKTGSWSPAKTMRLIKDKYFKKGFTR
jgi:serine/threonine protein kinase